MIKVHDLYLLFISSQDATRENSLIGTLGLPSFAFTLDHTEAHAMVRKKLCLIRALELSMIVRTMD